MSFKSSEETKNSKVILPLPDESLLQYSLKKAEEELNETPETKRNALKELRVLFKESPKTRDIDFEEDFLVHYLRASKYSVKRAYNYLQNYVDLWKKHSGLFLSLPDDYFLTKVSVKAVTVIPKRCPEGCIVVVIQIGKLKLDEVPFEDIKRGFHMVFVQIARDPMVQIHGCKIIYDFKGTGVQHIKFATLQNLWLLYHIPSNCCPARWKGVHAINPTVLLKSVWIIIKPFLSEKLKSRVYFHSDTQELLDYFPLSILPVEYGGELSELDCTELIRYLNKEHSKVTMKGQPNFY